MYTSDYQMAGNYTIEFIAQNTKVKLASEPNLVQLRVHDPCITQTIQLKIEEAQSLSYKIGSSQLLIPIMIDAKAPSCLSQEADLQLECSGLACNQEYGVYELVKEAKDRFEITIQTDNKDLHGMMTFSLIARDESFGLVTISPRLNIDVSLNNPCFE